MPHVDTDAPSTSREVDDVEGARMTVLRREMRGHRELLALFADFASDASARASSGDPELVHDLSPVGLGRSAYSRTPEMARLVGPQRPGTTPTPTAAVYDDREEWPYPAKDSTMTDEARKAMGSKVWDEMKEREEREASAQAATASTGTDTADSVGTQPNTSASASQSSAGASEARRITAQSHLTTRGTRVQEREQEWRRGRGE